MSPQDAIFVMMESGMTQTKIAELCGVDQTTIWSLATGKNKDPKYTLGLELVRLGKLAKRRMNK